MEKISRSLKEKRLKANETEENLSYFELLGEAKKEMPELSDSIKDQLDNYLFFVRDFNQEREEELSPQDRERELTMLYFKLWQFYASREKRVKDLQSTEVKEAIGIKKNLFPLGVPKSVLCIDGRVLAKLLAGLHGNSLKTPGGDIIDVVPSRKRGGGDKLREGRFTKLIDAAMEEQDELVEIFDSHINCKAGGEAAREKGALTEIPLDNGLLLDVERKKKIARATLKYVGEKYGNKKNIVVIQTSFDPHNGFMYLGLEKNECLEDARVKDKGYVSEILEKLTQEGKIIHTQSLLEENEGRLREIFRENYFKIDYAADYKKSTLLFWQNIKKMIQENNVLEDIKTKLQNVFNYLREPQNEKELIERAIFTLANVYSGYLHNYDKMGEVKKYPYSKHTESLIAVTPSERGPFDRAHSFSLDPETPNLSEAIRLAQGIIQNNRRAGAFSVTEKKAVDQLYGEDLEKYTSGPIVSIFFEFLPKMPREEMINQLQKADWGKLREINWLEMETEEFIEWLEKLVPEIPATIAKRINNMRKRAIEIYQPGQPATSSFLDGRLVPVFTLTGPNRETIALLPFIVRGY